MSGIFPSGGTEPQSTQNAQVGLRLLAACKALFYRTGCNPRFDPAATNAIISEIGNAINKLGKDYDCSKLDNLANAIADAIAGAGSDPPNFSKKMYPLPGDYMYGELLETNTQGNAGETGKFQIHDALRLAPGTFPLFGPLETDVIAAGRVIEYLDTRQLGIKFTVADLLALFLSKVPGGGGGGPVTPQPMPFGSDYAWQGVAFPAGQYQNNWSRPILLHVPGTAYGPDGGASTTVATSTDGNGWVTFEPPQYGAVGPVIFSIIVPPSHHYRYNGATGSVVILAPV